MRHVMALFIKFTLIAWVLTLVLTVGFDVSFLHTVYISLALTALSYTVGDLLIFLNAGSPADQPTRNAVATVVDFVLAFLVIWLIGCLLTGNNTEMVTPALASAVVISGMEWFFHLLVDRFVVPQYNNLKALRA